MATDDRLQRLLGGGTLAALRTRLRQRFGRAAAGTGVEGFRITGLTPGEHAALAALLGRPQRFAASIRVDVAAIDAALQRADVAASLRAALEQLDGPIVDRAAERVALQIQWNAALGACTHPALVSLVQTATGVGLLKRLAGQNHAMAARSLALADAVLRQLPARGVTRAQLAANVLGDAHALDGGCVVATLVLAVLRSSLTQEVPLDAEDADPEGLSPAGPLPRGLHRSPQGEGTPVSQRDLWASAGVLVNELARPALVLNLPGVAALGEPAYLSLRSLLRAPPAWAVQGLPVFVCENPNLLAIAADHLGGRCAPLVCTEGMPAAAQRTLLTQLARAGAVLRYHGDFDWPGLHIGNHVLREHGARPWRFCAIDYEAALRSAPLPGRPLHAATVEASWDGALAAAMRTAARAIDEEMVAEALLQDLASVSTS